MEYLVNTKSLQLGKETHSVSTQRSTAVCSSHPSQVKETALVGAQIVLAVLERGQQVLQQDPDPRCLEWVGGRFHSKVGNPRGQLLQGSKAVLEQFQGDGGGGPIHQTHRIAPHRWQ